MEDRMAAKELPDTAYLHECFDYEPKTGVLVWKHRPRAHFKTYMAWRIWTSKYPGKVAGNVGIQGHVVVRVNSKNFYVHRLIWKLQTGADPKPGEVIDHHNRDRADNRWSNLRVATPSQSSRNCSVRSSHSLLKGVYRRPSGRYGAKGWTGDHIVWLGTYDTQEEAHAAYCAFASAKFGEFFSPG
jgi:hypothetical protein